MADLTREEIIDDFSKDMMEGSGDISSELGDKNRILTFIKTLNVINAQSNPNIALKINVLDSLWEELEVKANDKVITIIDNILTEMSPYRIKYSKTITRGLNPKQKNLAGLFFHTKKYTLALRKEAHKQLNKKQDGKHE